MANLSNPFVSSQRALLETAQDVSFKTLEGMSKLVELNLQATRAVISEATEKLSSRLEAGGVNPADRQVANVMQPSAQKAAAYAKHVYDIVAETNADIVTTLQKHALTFSPELATQMMGAAGKGIAGNGNEAFFAALSNPFGAAQKLFQQAVDTSTEVATKAAAAPRRAAAAATAA